MKTANDTKILDLKASIEKKKKEVKNQKFQPLTSCVLTVHGETSNIHTLGYKGLELLLVEITALHMAAQALKIGNFELCGFPIVHWIADIQSKMEIISAKEEEQKLKQMETKLSKLLSTDAQVELEISEIEKALL